MDATGGEATAAVDSFAAEINHPTIHEHAPFANGNATSQNDENNDLVEAPSYEQIQTMQDEDILPLTETLFRISARIFQPPVVGALLGLFIASFPNLRGLLENIWGDESRTAPLQWLFDGIYSVGQAAVPINMTILGINLSSTFQKKSKTVEKSKTLSTNTMLAVVIGKMVVMPVIGIISTWLLQRYYIDLPDGGC